MSAFVPRSWRDGAPDQEFPPPWRAIVTRHVPYARRLTPDQRAVLERHIRVFLEKKYFEGAGGLRLHDVHRVTIAAHAALLMLGGNS
ncbi:MAG TPA: zinc-dependent peptidase, partial [Gemmatimonadaceae bacterium]|nr:zinc-dependent peptidase [Gemmatimonadaceae bacterium]